MWLFACLIVEKFNEFDSNELGIKIIVGLDEDKYKNAEFLREKTCIVIHFDERWMLIVYHLQARKLEVFDV